MVQTAAEGDQTGRQQENCPGLCAREYTGTSLSKCIYIHVQIRLKYEQNCPELYEKLLGTTASKGSNIWIFFEDLRKNQSVSVNCYPI
jgi:hypothetical protein